LATPMTTGMSSKRKLVYNSKERKMIYIILATVLANIIYKAYIYGRGDIADVIIFIAAFSIALQ
jgi:hypothetical protein